MKPMHLIIAGAVLSLSAAHVAHAAEQKTPATANSTAVARPAAKPAPRKEAVRTLDAIRIEGEIDVPQVLFITARDTRRFRDGTGTTYQPASTDVARSIRLPSRLRMVAPIE